MYRILLADDEGIAIDSLTYIIEKTYGDKCEIRSARTGRSVIEIAENFRPDIAVMDIQMPGINGIEAIREIRKFSPTTVYIVLTAYDKFDYAKEAIDLGVLNYLSKPIDRDIFVDAMNGAISRIESERAKRSKDLRAWEKLETVIPVIESGFVYSLLLQENSSEETDRFRSLLDITENSGYVLLIECGEEKEDNGSSSGQTAKSESHIEESREGSDDDLDNPIGTGIRIRKYYSKIRDILKEYNSKAIIGDIMMNKIPVFVPHGSGEPDYNERIEIIDKIRMIVTQLEDKTCVCFRIGIGKVKPMPDMKTSYQEALRSLFAGGGPVSHADDLPVACEYEKDYPIDTENQIFDGIKRGDVDSTADAADRFFIWMQETQENHESSVRLKALEFVLWAEHIAYQDGGMGLYRFTDRADYMDISQRLSLDELHDWFVRRIKEAAAKIADKTKSRADSLTDRAKAYIDGHYQNDISLDDVSREMNISPYYFSKLFKEEAGITFIEYLTTLRMTKAKALLSDPAIPVKEVGTKVGYQDPNYFSRIFKRYTGKTPTEFRG
jgi:two-component system response regulator YesN